jgi:hypothetical protein
MGTFAETQLSLITVYRLPTKENSDTVCSKQTEVCHFLFAANKWKFAICRFPFEENKWNYINIYIYMLLLFQIENGSPGTFPLLVYHFLNVQTEIRCLSIC